VLGALQTGNTRDRRAGFRAGLEEVGLPWSPEQEAEWLIEGPTHARGLDEPDMERLRALLMAPNGPTAFFCGGYNLALATMEGVRSTRLRIPDQVSVVGFDDPLSAAHLHPPLTTIRQPLVEMGAHAMSRLLRVIAEGVPSSGTELLDTELILRESCAPPGG
jgi:DNA-binding LacI/PurR family transcriptional regulator